MGQISGIGTREVGLLGWDKSGIGTQEVGLLGWDKSVVSALKRWVSFVGTIQWYQHPRGGFLGLGQISDIGTQVVGFLGWDKPVRSTLKRSVFGGMSFCILWTPGKCSI